MERVAKRVSNGGHNIPDDVIERRYYRGLKNLLQLYIPISDHWIIVDNMDQTAEIIAKGSLNEEKIILNPDIWNNILKRENDN